MPQKTIAINGVVYDQRTGNPLTYEREALPQHDAHDIHRTLQRSTTLRRKYVSNPHASVAAPTQQAVPVQPATADAQAGAPKLTPATHSQHTITKFASHPIKPPAAPRRVIADIAPTASHPVAARAHARHQAKKAAATPVKPSQVLKNEAIAEATARTTSTSRKKEARIAKPLNPFRRALGIASASLGLLLLGGYLTYLSMPNISTRVAAAQAGINASYPSYKPSGYSLSGPVTFQQGAVSMKFAANGTPVSYTLTQAKSGWDSVAVLDNYVIPKAGNEFSTTSANGLTIYTFNQDAAWVSGGILYTISGNAPLSNEQIQHIATSV